MASPSMSPAKSGSGLSEVSAAAAQMLNFYGVPSSVGAGMTDAKLPDCQAGYEKALAVALAANGAGSMLAALALLGAVQGQLSAACWLILLAVFITDASWTLVWRMATGQPFTLTFNREVMASALRFLTYSPETQAMLPMLIHEAATGNRFDRDLLPRRS